MGNKEETPLLERKHAISLILKAKDNPGLNKTDLASKDGEANGNDRTRFIRINELVDAGIFTVDEDNRQHNTMHVYLTNKGQRIAALLEKVLAALDE